MKNIHILPTDKPSRLFIDIEDNKLKITIPIGGEHMMNQNIYITNDEEIIEEDWCIDKHNVLYKQETDKIFSEFTGSKKIILTTDTDLIQDDVQAIDDDFLEWFIKNTSCEYVGVKKGFADGTAYGYNFLDYKIIIPKEEKCTCKEHDPYCCQIHGNCPTCVKKEELKQENCCTPLGQIKRYEDCYGCDRKPKQEKLTYTESAKKEERISNSIMMKRKKETLEEVAKRYAIQVYKGKIVYHGFIDGAKWQQERMYSEEDMKLAFETGRNFQLTGENNFVELIEQLKKK